jgi:type I restriction enzyme S subunit
MRSVPVIVPDLQYVQNYNALVQPMYDLIETLESENQILAALRDTLLPKLMSGEIEVPVV